MTPSPENRAANPIYSVISPASAEVREVLCEEAFIRMIAVERKRTERTKLPFLLMLIDAPGEEDSDSGKISLDGVAYSLASSTRETDLVGWYKNNATVGVLYTGITIKESRSVVAPILKRVNQTLECELTADQVDQVGITFHFFPDDWDVDGDSGHPSNPTLYPDLSNREVDNRPRLVIKRVIDVLGSALILIVASPLLLIIAIAIKASSKGPVLFRQQRVGQHGQRFTFLKFRSMKVNNDPGVHKEFVTGLITKKAKDEQAGGSSPRVYKLVNDKRITRVGRLLRRSSLDELPQVLNVLSGDMSLVGPRPPLPYEVAVYQTWHRRRVLEVKPGLTGLWQVSGRSRVTFDEMVRLDLRYAASWSLWLDFKILLRTPIAVIKGSGAF